MSWLWSDSADPKDRDEWALDGEVKLPPGVERVMQLHDTNTGCAILTCHESEAEDWPGLCPNEVQAALIRHAPDLLRELKRMVDFVRKNKKFLSAFDEYGLIEEEWLTPAEEVIIKAEKR
jgi:predicted transglutaminase-like cysteine proteinase